jgi:hypothetical protein
MNASAAIADSPLRHASMRLAGMLASGLAPRGLDVLFQVRLGLSGLHALVSHGDCTISRRTAMNNAG